MRTMPKTKDELITILLERGGHHRPALMKLRRDDLAALAEHAESHDVMADDKAVAEVEKAAPVAAPPAPTGDLLVPVEEVVAGDTWAGGVKIKAIQSGPKWTWIQARNGDWFAQIRTGVKVQIVR